MPPSSSHPIDETSYGIIPLRLGKEGWDVLLVQSQHHFWGLPKGHPEPNETPKQTAARELKEETGLEIVRFFPNMSFEENYTFFRGGRRVHKRVLYFPAQVAGEVVLQVKEMSQSAWVSLKGAEELATYPEMKSILRKAYTEIA